VPKVDRLSEEEAGVIRRQNGVSRVRAKTTLAEEKKPKALARSAD